MIFYLCHALFPEERIISCMSSQLNLLPRKWKLREAREGITEALNSKSRYQFEEYWSDLRTIIEAFLKATTLTNQANGSKREKKINERKILRAIIL